MDAELKERLKPLTTQVKWLGACLGTVLKDQEGKAFFDLVEDVRKTSIELRRNYHQELETKLISKLRRLNVEQMTKLIRAFTVYFQLINLAEDMQRIRRRRRYAFEGHVQPGSIDDICERLKSSKVSFSRVEKIFKDYNIELVLTAHPTEAQRRLVLEKLSAIDNCLYHMESRILTPDEREEIEGKIREYITLLWQTSDLRERKRTVLDEVDHVLYYLDKVLYQTLPKTMIKFKNDVSKIYKKDIAYQPVIKFGSWVGGDRDGNPFVTHDITWETVRRQKEVVLRRYIKKLDQLIRHYSQSGILTGSSRELIKSLHEDQVNLPLFTASLRGAAETEPYRMKLMFVQRKLINSLRLNLQQTSRATAPDSTIEASYENSDDFTDELKMIRRSLVKYCGEDAAMGLNELLWAVKTFGFYLARLDIREHAGKIQRVTAEVLKKCCDVEGFEELGEDQKTQVLVRLLKSKEAHALKGKHWSEETKEVLDTFNTIQEIRQKISKRAIQSYIMSMSQNKSDVLSALWLARVTGNGDLMIVPLFETVEDLREAFVVMKSLYEEKVYRKHLERLGDAQEIMIGYSDSCKSGGYLSSHWQLYQAQKNIARVSRKYGVKHKFFHGRGGAIGRGGGPINQAIMAQPAGTIDGRMKLTEQGEVIALKYSNPAMAERNLELVLSAVLAASVTEKKKISDYETYTAVMNELSDISQKAYQDLVYNNEHFLDYFFGSTPIQQISELNLGSRPAKRMGDRNIENLRAIPWVFSWMQSRQMVPGWFGFGSAYQAYVSKHDGDGVKLFREMYRDWPFFKTIVDFMQMSMHKADMHIAKRYADLVEDSETERFFYGRIKKEFNDTRNAILEITNQKNLLEESPELQHSIRLRNPYVDPLSYAQIILLEKMRSEKGRRSNEMKRAIALSINGIAHGLRNTG